MGMGRVFHQATTLLTIRPMQMHLEAIKNPKMPTIPRTRRKITNQMNLMAHQTKIGAGRDLFRIQMQVATPT